MATWLASTWLQEKDRNCCQQLHLLINRPHVGSAQKSHQAGFDSSCKRVAANVRQVTSDAIGHQNFNVQAAKQQNLESSTAKVPGVTLTHTLPNVKHELCGGCTRKAQMTHPRSGSCVVVVVNSDIESSFCLPTLRYYRMFSWCQWLFSLATKTIQSCSKQYHLYEIDCWSIGQKFTWFHN